MHLPPSSSSQVVEIPVMDSANHRPWNQFLHVTCKDETIDRLKRKANETDDRPENAAFKTVIAPHLFALRISRTPSEIC